MWGAARIALLAVTLVMLGHVPAQAGRAVITGHDADLHCSTSSSPTENQCHYMKVALDYVRAGSSKPVLVLDRLNLDVVRALDNAYGAGVVPRTVMDPRGGDFASAPINTATYSAIIVASDTTCGGCDLNESGSTPDSDAIIARKGAIEAFFNAGGGILALSGASHGDGSDPDDRYYGFLPVPVGGVAVAPPFTLTPEGKALGFTDGTGGTPDDVNCCPTHNSFELPAAGGALKVAETDSKGKAETLFVEGEISGDRFTPAAPPTAKPPAFGPGGVITGLPSAKKCVSRRSFRIRIRQRRGRKYVSALVFLNGRRVITRRGSRVTARIDLRGLPRGRFTVRIVVLTTRGETITGTRRYRTCARKLPGGSPGPL